MDTMHMWIRACVALLFPADPDADAERGDVPGWVLITLMTAALVAALWAVAGPRLIQIFQDAMDKVSII